MATRIRRARQGEAEAVAALNGVVQQLHYEQRPDWFKAPDAAAFLPVVEGWLASDDVAVFVAEDDGGTLLGYSVGVRHERPENPLTHSATFVELDQVAIAPAARRLGLGRSLSEAVLQWADDHRVDRVELSTWAFNDGAHRLFETLGFTPTVRRMSLPLHHGRSPRG